MWRVNEVKGRDFATESLDYCSVTYTTYLLPLEESAKTDLLTGLKSTDSTIIYTRLAVHTSRRKLPKVFTGLSIRSQQMHKSFFFKTYSHLWRECIERTFLAPHSRCCKKIGCRARMGGCVIRCLDCQECTDAGRLKITGGQPTLKVQIMYRCLQTCGGLMPGQDTQTSLLHGVGARQF